MKSFNSNLQSFLSKAEEQKVNQISWNPLEENNFESVNENILCNFTIRIP